MTDWTTTRKAALRLGVSADSLRARIEVNKLAYVVEGRHRLYWFDDLKKLAAQIRPKRRHGEPSTLHPLGDNSAANQILGCFGSWVPSTAPQSRRVNGYAHR
jgi:hypothetical protein